MKTFIIFWLNADNVIGTVVGPEGTTEAQALEAFVQSRKVEENSVQFFALESAHQVYVT